MYRLGAVLLLVAWSCAANAQAPPSMLKLTCDGTATDSLDPGAKDGLALMGIIVNFTDSTVQGFGYPYGSFNHPVMINDCRRRGSRVLRRARGGSIITRKYHGSIDPVTGDVEATLSLIDQKTSKATRQITYTLQCKPTQRVF